MAPFDIRIVGDPVLKQRAQEIENVDGALVRLVDDMVETMYEAPGVGLAAPQVGVQKRLFVYDIGEGPQTLVNPTLVEGDGEWVFDEGCLSVPGLSWEIVRPKQVHLTGHDLDGNQVDIEADEYLARVFQHEMDHLDGILILDRTTREQRKEALRILREGPGAAGDTDSSEDGDSAEDALEHDGKERGSHDHDQFSVGRSRRSITSTSRSVRDGSSRSPSCSRTAVNTDGASLGGADRARSWLAETS